MMIRRAYQITGYKSVGNTLAIQNPNRIHTYIPNRPRYGLEEHPTNNTKQTKGNVSSKLRPQDQLVGHTVDEQVLPAHYLGGNDMTFLRHAPIFNCKPKASTTTPSPAFPRKETVTLFLLRWLLSRLATSWFFKRSSKDLDLLKKKNSVLQESVEKVKLDATTKHKEIEDLGKGKGQAEEKGVEMANAFRTMSRIETQGLGGNIFPNDVEVLNTAKVIEGTRKVVDDPNTPVA
uniref:Uncharacterized protein n=1 Tax=Cannabis sativa TaxID=3483 RepID=A0A803PTK6_CANSA